MNRKQFIQSHGATCKNWMWSWSFINEHERFVIFGAWRHHTHGERTLILGDAWASRRSDGAKNSGFEQSREHVRRVVEDGFRLFTFPIIAVGNPDTAPIAGPAKIKRSVFELSERALRREADGWYAYGLGQESQPPVVARQARPAWLFQGNPRYFDLDGYLARCPEFVYWRTNRYLHEIKPGDSAAIWRAGRKPALVAIGRIAESPTRAAAVREPNAIGREFLRTDSVDPEELLTGIALEEVRLELSEGCVARASLQADGTLRTSSIITSPQATVFRMDARQTDALLALWRSASGVTGLDAGSESPEGRRRLVAHWRRERSGWIRKKKLETCAGRCRCEICGLEQPGRYPAVLAPRVFEVHHRVPLARAQDRVITRLEDLAILCANCHRAVHATETVEENFAALARSM